MRDFSTLYRRTGRPQTQSQVQMHILHLPETHAFMLCHILLRTPVNNLHQFHCKLFQRDEHVEYGCIDFKPYID